ncbi:LAFA_0D10968g1_1 [Lachancea sp. 'fantastica']|nr:LAFA_0D10968g1_1 [Lachancea sp. 'fantastica']
MKLLFGQWASGITSSRFYTNAARPLNVLFFGSDQFSVHSLNALYKLRETSPRLIDKIQVVTRSAKKCGRNLSIIKEAPIASCSRDLHLPPVIECDTKQDMLGPVMNAMHGGDFNMIIAVSFGKLIPKQLLAKSEYSLNVHPSLLPRYKGSSPIQYTLLNNDTTTGVSIQTLHPEKFDCGKVIAQTEPLEVKTLLAEKRHGGIDPDSNVTPKVAKLMDALGERGALLLTKVIKSGWHNAEKSVSTPYAESLAPKITTQMRQLHWKTDLAESAISKLDALGSVYAFKTVCQKNGGHHLKRIIFHKLSPYEEGQPVPAALSMQPGSFEFDSAHKCMALRFQHGKALQCILIQFEGFKIESPEQFFKSIRKRCGKSNEDRTFI